jgi:integrase
MLSRQDLERLREGYRARGDCNNTLNKKQAYIRAILAWGADQELIDRNPWRDFKRLPVARNICATTIQDIRAVLQVAPDWLKWSIATCFALSLRPGHIELFSLLWSAFDWRRGLVMVRQGKSGRLKTVFPPAQYMQIANDRYKCDIERGIQLVCHRNGKRIYAYNKAWEKVIKNARVQHFPMYHIRHVAASEMLAGGADLASVAAQLGHSNVNTTGAFYAHVTAGGQQRAAAILPNLQA